MSEYDLDDEYLTNVRPVENSDLNEADKDRYIRELESKIAELEVSAIADSEREDRKAFRSIVDHVAAGIAQADASGRITYANAYFCKLLGYSCDELFGMRLQDITHPDSDSTSKKLFEKIADGHTDIEIETRYVRMDGQPVWLNSCISVVRNSTGQIQSFIVLCVDTTRFKQTETALRESETRFKMTLKSAPIIVTNQDRDLRYTWIYSPQSECNSSDIIGKTDADLLPADESARLTTLKKRVIISGTAAHEDVEITLHNRKCLYQVHAEPLLNDDGEITGIMATTFDISARRQAEAENKRLALLMEHSSDFIGLSDLKYRFSYLNAAALYMLGMNEEEAYFGCQFTEYMAPDSLNVFRETVMPATLENGSWEGELQLIDKQTGAIIDTLCSTSALTDPYTDKPIGFGIVMRDVTEQKRSKQALQDANARLLEADRRKNEFLAMLAHELRNPLAPIRHSLEILQLTRDTSPLARQLYKTMQRQVSHLVRLIDDLTDVSRITRGKITLRKERIELNTFIRTTVRESMPLIEAAHIQLLLDLPNEALTLNADPVRLAQVFTNILNNGAKYSNQNGRIWLSVRRDREEAEVMVRDEGIGIPADALPHIFEMFTQANNSPDHSQGGLGIGLTLVRDLVELHGGKISARSDGPGKGCEFVIRLPLLNTSRRYTDQPQEESEVSVAQRRVLIVDDNEAVAESLAMLLKMHGAEVHIAYDGQAALNALPAFQPQVIVMDIGMPGMNGYEVARRIRQQPAFPDVTLIALTGWGQDSDRERAMEAGFDHHVVKLEESSKLLKLIGVAAVRDNLEIS